MAKRKLTKHWKNSATTPNPGSYGAREAGCSCDMMENGYGTGSAYKQKDGSQAFWITDGCPVHAPRKDQP